MNSNVRNDVVLVLSDAALVSRFLFAPYLCSLFRPPLYSRFVVQLPSSRCLRKTKLYFMPLSTHILLISLWRKLIRKICVEKSMKLSGVSFPAISLEDSPRIVGTNIVFFSQGDRFVPEDVNLFCFFFKASVFSRFCSTGLLLKPSGFLYTGLRNMKLYFMPFFTHILLISLWRKLIRNSQDMRTESMKLWDVSFPGISLQDSPTIVGTNIVYFSQGEDFFFFFLFPFTFLLAKL
ncbi:hypothetical protein LXL04_003428 [Taraxacum kok-saghyz]